MTYQTRPIIGVHADFILPARQAQQLIGPESGGEESKRICPVRRSAWNYPQDETMGNGGTA